MEEEKLRQRGQPLAETLNLNGLPEDIWESAESLDADTYENFEKGSAGRSSLKPVPTGFSSRQGTTLPFGWPAPSPLHSKAALLVRRWLYEPVKVFQRRLLALQITSASMS